MSDIFRVKRGGNVFSLRLEERGSPRHIVVRVANGIATSASIRLCATDTSEFNPMNNICRSCLEVFALLDEEIYDFECEVLDAITPPEEKRWRQSAFKRWTIQG